MKKIVLLLLSLLLCRCSTMGGSIGLGAGVGAGAGFTASKIAQYNTKGTIVLTASGALIGGVLGALLHRAPPGSIPIPGINESPPPLKDADTDVMWVPDSILDGKYVEGHKVWLLKNPAHWELKPANPDPPTKSAAKSKPNGKKP